MMRKLAVVMILLLLSGWVGARENASAYKPKTKHDNTPYRFNMQQNGKHMTAKDFDAWMKSRGIRVAKGAPAKRVKGRKKGG